MERRDFFRSLVALGAPVKLRDAGRNRREHHKRDVVYHGPMAVPERIAAIVAAHPALARTTHRHLVSRYAEAGWTWLFRCQVPESRQMVGEIVRTPEGAIRIHCWSAARFDGRAIEEPGAIVARKSESSASPSAPILPPLEPALACGGARADRYLYDADSDFEPRP